MFSASPLSPLRLRGGIAKARPHSWQAPAVVGGSSPVIVAQQLDAVGSIRGRLEATAADAGEKLRLLGPPAPPRRGEGSLQRGLVIKEAERPG